MEKRSDRHIRDLVAHTAFKGLDANEIGCARISVMAGSNCSLQRAEYRCARPTISGERPLGIPTIRDYLAPSSVIEEWKKTDLEKRKAAEEKMRADRIKWIADHAKSLADKGAGVGRTKRVTSQGISDTKNDVMLYAIVEADFA